MRISAAKALAWISSFARVRLRTDVANRMRRLENQAGPGRSVRTPSAVQTGLVAPLDIVTKGCIVSDIHQ